MKSILLQLNFLFIHIINSLLLVMLYPFSNLLFLLIGIKVPYSSCIHRKVKIFSLGKMKLGKNCVINSGCYLDNRRGIYLGNNVGIAHDTKIYTLGHDIDNPYFPTKGAPVYIDDDVFVFSNALIMPGVRLSRGTIVLPGSIVTKSTEPFSVVGGNPARYIRERNKEVHYKLNYRYWFAI